MVLFIQQFQQSQPKIDHERQSFKQHKRMQEEILHQSLVAQKQMQTIQHEEQIKEQHLENLNQLKAENSKLSQELKTTKQEQVNQVQKIKEKLQQLQQENAEFKSSQQGKIHFEQLNKLEVENRKLIQDLETIKQEQEKRVQRIEGKVQQENGEFWSSWVINKSDIILCERELGRGAHGWVKEATFQGCRVAVKCLHNLIISSYNLKIFNRGMNMAARCRHPNLLQFIGATSEGDGVPFIVTELMHTSLRQLLQCGKLSSNHIIPIMLGVALGLNYLHKHEPPILHRDVSSCNVLLNPLPSNQWFAKLAGFGSTNFLKQCETICPGNSVYAAPESWNYSKGGHTPAMDTFSFGILLHELCSRTYPDGTLTPESIKCTDWKAPESQLISLIISCINQEIGRRPTMDTVVTQLKVLIKIIMFVRTFHLSISYFFYCVHVCVCCVCVCVFVCLCMCVCVC